jgi:hypothetical protein
MKKAPKINKIMDAVTESKPTKVNLQSREFYHEKT